MYLLRVQEWRLHSAHANIRDQCDRPPAELTPSPPPFTLRAHPGDETVRMVSVATWAERMVSWASYIARSAWKVTAYGMPTGVGIAAGIVRNHRAVLAAPVFFSDAFVIWAWYSGSPGSFSAFAAQTHENAKALRAAISEGLLEIARRMWCIEMSMVIVAMEVAFRKI